MKGIIASLAIFAITFWICFPSNILPKDHLWERVDEGLFVREFDSPQKSKINDSKITILKIDPKFYSFKLLCASEHGKVSMTPKKWCQKHNLSSAVNAGMYQKDGITNVGYMKNFNHINNPRSTNAYKAVLAFNPVESTIPVRGVSGSAKIETDRIDDGISTHLGMADLVLKPNIPREVNIDGTEWGAMQRTMIPFDKYTPQLQSKGDKIYYVWEESDGKHRQIWTSSVHEDGTGWKSEKRTKSLYGKYDPQFQIVGNKIYYVWHEDHGPIEPIWVAEEILIK